jgi:signal transduction histidine kinase
MFDPITNKLDTLDIDYNCATRIYNNKNEIMIINTIEGTTELIALTRRLEVKYRKFLSDDLLEFNPDSRILINKEIYYVLKRPFSIYNKNFDLVYTSDIYIDREFVQLKNNSFAVKATINSRFENKYDKVSHLHLKIRKKIKNSALYFILLEIIIMFSYFFFRSTLFIPLPEAGKNYIILFTIFGFIHTVKTHGKKNLFVFSKRVTRSKKQLIEAIYQIDSSAKIISSKSFVLYKYVVYEISSPDEMLAIQIIAHDIKNNIANIKFLTERGTANSDQNLKESIKSALNDSVKLSNFTNLTRINYTKVNIEKLINKIIREFTLTSTVFFDAQFSVTNHELTIDEKKFETVLRNIFQNSIDAFEEETKADNKIIVTLEETGNNLYMTVKNKISIEIDAEKVLKLGYTTKQTGTGTGLYIVKRIIESINGEMHIKTDDGYFTVLIKLKRNDA